MADWWRAGLICSIGLAPHAHAQPLEPPACVAASAATHDGFLALRTGAEDLGLPLSAQALQRWDRQPFAAIIVPSGMRAPAPVGPASKAPPLLTATRSTSGSALVRADVPLSVDTVEWNRRSVSIVAYMPPGGEPRAVAAVMADRSNEGPTRVTLHSLAPPGLTEPNPKMELAAQEYLYTLAFREDPAARYCVPSPAADCEDSALVSQPEALRSIARQRACALAALPEAARRTLPSWRLVMLQPRETNAARKSLVSARIFDETGPLAGASVTFSQLPHSGCTATARADGSATCELVDDHGHDGEDAESHGQPVVVTFPGDLRGDPILLPTTILIRNPPADGDHADRR
ncbi:hypothetical protein [Piscinibacter koreensis]|uniref:Uncharacterized protein n=1 Tax=Piscinibacter koreensis TaxID=2742824 RepID=A0A7Y6NP06_9BURK|nr:hypothetical protein [Schlegelella koreensis]NUZ06539.1 hypothetical protein [Schlegelella koreensis]